MAAKTLAESQLNEQALTSALFWQQKEIEQLRGVLGEIEAMIDDHALCMPGESCSARDDISEIVEKWKNA